MIDGEPIMLKKKQNATIAKEGVLGRKRRNVEVDKCQRKKLNAAEVFDYGNPHWSYFPWLKSAGKSVYGMKAQALTKVLKSDFLKYWFS